MDRVSSVVLAGLLVRGLSEFVYEVLIQVPHLGGGDRLGVQVDPRGLLHDEVRAVVLVRTLMTCSSPNCSKTSVFDEARDVLDQILAQLVRILEVIGRSRTWLVL